MDPRDWAIFRRNNAFNRLSNQLEAGATLGLNSEIKPAADYLVAAGRQALGLEAPEPSDAYTKAKSHELAKNAYALNEFGPWPRVLTGMGIPATSIAPLYHLSQIGAYQSGAQGPSDDPGKGSDQSDEGRYAVLARALLGYTPAPPDSGQE